MFGKYFELNEQTMEIIRAIGRHMPGGFFIYKAGGNEDLIYANDATIRLFGWKNSRNSQAIHFEGCCIRMTMLRSLLP